MAARCERCKEVNAVYCVPRPETKLFGVHLVSEGRSMMQDGHAMGVVNESIDACQIAQKKVQPEDFWPGDGGGAVITDGVLHILTKDEMFDMRLKEQIRRSLQNR